MNLQNDHWIYDVEKAPPLCFAHAVPNKLPVVFRMILHGLPYAVSF